jgi:arginase
MNTPETTPSGNVHGMALAGLTGLGPSALSNLIDHSPIVEPAHVALIGVRDIDEEEKSNVRNSGIHVFTMRDIDELGMRTVVERSIKVISRGTTGIHVSLDMDFVDPAEAPGVGTPVPGGVTYREAHLAMELVADSGRMASFEVVEVNPILDSANRTGKLAVELACSAFGRRIL